MNTICGCIFMPQPTSIGVSIASVFTCPASFVSDLLALSDFVAVSGDSGVCFLCHRILHSVCQLSGSSRCQCLLYPCGASLCVSGAWSFQQAKHETSAYGQFCFWHPAFGCEKYLRIGYRGRSSGHGPIRNDS